MLNNDDFLNDYFEILFTPLPWLVIILWHFILGLTVLFVVKAFSKGELKCKSIFAMTALYTWFGFCVEMLKGVAYCLISIFVIWYINATGKMDLAHKTIYSLWHSGFSITEVLLMVFSVFSTVGFGLLIYFFVMRKATISKRLKIITSIILSVFSGAFYILYL